MDETRTLAAFLAGATYDSLPSATRQATSLAILDWIGSAMAGSLEPPARIAREVAAGFGVSDEASVFSGGRASAPAAAFANGVASHILELDDIHKGSTVHGAAPIIPAALATAERARASGRDVMLAVALGYEAGLRAGEAVNPSHYRFWHPTGTAATFGSAAAAGSVIGLHAEQMAHALGSAGTTAAGLWEFNADGAMSKHLHPGNAALNGVVAADLAKRGFTGASRILEGERGFIRAMSDGGDAGRITADLGDVWKVTENGYKLHSCCGHTHTAVDSALELRERFALDEIASIRIALYGPGYQIVKEPNPRTPYQAQFSAAYCVAAGLVDGVVGLAQFDAARFSDGGVVEPAIAGLLAVTTVEIDDALSARYPARWPSRLTISLRSGAAHEREADFPRGHAEHPVERAVLERKAFTLIAPRFGEDAAARALAFVAALPETEDVSAAMRALMR